jgi:23S rRNA (guanine2445-N2)-methyltransferase / 23S rRNA (guanine2069-N7)-methyltransferase
VPQETVPCYNGPLNANLRIYALGALPTKIAVTSPSGANCNVTVAERASGQFAARLRKAAKERAKWARKAGVQSYRVYDADLPDYAVSLEIYQGTNPATG